MAWSSYVALGDSLTAGQGDTGPDGRRIGWARRLADLLSARTGVRCTLTNLAVDRATVTQVLRQQLPGVAPIGPDLVSLTVGMNDIRTPAFDERSFGADLEELLDGLTATGATVLTCTLPDIAAIIPLPPQLVEPAQRRMREVSDVIRTQSASRGVVCLDVWALPEVADPSLYSSDRVHPSAHGHQRLATAFADKLAPAGHAPI